MFWAHVELLISEQRHQPFKITSKNNLGGGCINQALKISDGTKNYFIKINTIDLLTMFEAERVGLEALPFSQCIRIPSVLLVGTFEDKSFLILEFINMNSKLSNHQLLAQQLVSLHRQSHQQFGFKIDNFIGASTQKNTWEDSWVTFYAKHRLSFQLKIAKLNGYHSFLDDGYLLIESLALFFVGYQPKPSLLHGDLWSGNYAYDEQGQPVIFDPATYYGDREADIAMTELFGGFSPEFYQNYNDLWPLDKGYKVRKHLYNLYHIINHCNLFGGSYQQQAHRIIKQLLNEVA